MERMMVTLYMFSLLIAFCVAAGETAESENKFLYDAIVIGAGAAGCPLAQTLVEGGKNVLLVERGGERPNSTQHISTSDLALRSDCAEAFFSNGVAIATGNCMGGATSFNQGIWIEDSEWLIQKSTELLGLDEEFFDQAEVEDAYLWVRSRVAPEPTRERPGSASETYITELTETLANRDDMDKVNPFAWAEYPGPGIIFRTHTIFDPLTGVRRSADTLLNREHNNLSVMTNHNVDKILFDGDRGVPMEARSSRIGAGSWQGRDSSLTARCVHFTTGKTACVKKDGKIFLAAGAFHTPELLIKSGIGKNGAKVDNSEVGENLSDKPGIHQLATFRKTFDNSGQVTYNNVASSVTKELESTGQQRTHLFEEGSVGNPTLMNLLAFFRALLPTFLRDSSTSNLVVKISDKCQDEILNGAREQVGPFDLNALPVSPLCVPFLTLFKAGCIDRFLVMAAFVSDPSSKGSVRIGQQGELNIDCNYLTHVADIEAIGVAARIGWEILSGLEGPSEPQKPCDENSGLCFLSSCPDLFKLLENVLVQSVQLLEPDFANDVQFLKDVPASLSFPNVVEFGIGDIGLNDFDLGVLLSKRITSPNHFAGTARLGSVLDGKFRVKGTSNLYVADAAALPSTPRVNPMATIMAVGRLVGAETLAEAYR